MLHTSYSENSILPVTDIISSKINTYLFSTQGELGGHNFGGKLVFELEKKFFSHEYEKDSGLKFKGNRYVPKLKDKEFLKMFFVIKMNYSKIKNNLYLSYTHMQGTVNTTDILII